MNGLMVFESQASYITVKKKQAMNTHYNNIYLK